MSSAPKRPLLKGPLQPPTSQLKSLSYTQPPSSKKKISTSVFTKEKPIPVIEFNSRAVPQPFLDPTIIPKRIQAEKQWKTEQERKKRAEGSSQSQSHDMI